jgi:hypothetical protein
MVPLNQTSDPNARRLIPVEVEPVVFRRLKLRKYLHEINLSPEETLALMRRLETESCRAEDYEVLIKMVRAHTHLSADLVEAPPVPEQSSPARSTTRKRQSAQSARRRQRR